MPFITRSVVEARVRNGVEEIQLIDGNWVSKREAERFAESQIRWIANEGVRTSKILDRVSEIQSQQGSSASGLVQAFLEDAKNIRWFPGTIPRESVVISTLGTTDLDGNQFSLERKRSKSGNRLSSGSVRPLSYYDGRQGYNPDFLGITIPLPELTPTALAFGPLARVEGADDNILRYTHFSIAMCETRRLAFYTAVNIEGSQWVGLERRDDEWFFDPRVPIELQVGNDFYSNEPGGNFFDRGHLVRRQDPIWGEENRGQDGQQGDVPLHKLLSPALSVQPVAAAVAGAGKLYSDQH